jgi:hypothetical protein
MFKSNLRLAAVAAAAVWASSAQAVVVVQWTFDGITAPAASTSWTGIAPAVGTGSASGVHAASATWSTPAGNGTPNSASANNWAVGDYWQFSFSTVGYFDLTLSFDQTSSNTGPRDFTLAYSTNGTTFTTLPAYQVLPNASPAWSSATYSPNYTFNVDLSALSALDNQPNVFVRLVNSSTVSANGGVVATGGTSRIDTFTVNLTPVPETGTAAMLLAGLAVLGFVSRRRLPQA